MNLRRPVLSVTLCVVAAVPMMADFSYEQTTQMTGGSLLQMMKMASVFSKDGRKLTQPMNEAISIKGNRMIRKSPDSATIIDVDRQTITTVDYAKKTFSVVTFEEMKQQMAAMQEKMKSSDKGNASFEVKLNDTGKTKNINGSDAHEVIMTMIMSGTDAKSGSKGAMNVASDMWIAPEIPGYGEAKDFQRRMAESLGWEPGQNPMMSRPDISKAMSEMYKNGSKLDGMPLTSTIRMGADLQGAPGSGPAATPAQDHPDNQQSSASQPSSSSTSSSTPSSASGALGEALAGRFGLGRHKKKDNNEAASGDQNTSGDPSSLIEMTSQVTGYNSAAVDEALFQIPAGFNKITPRGFGRN